MVFLLYHLSPSWRTSIACEMESYVTVKFKPPTWTLDPSKLWQKSLVTPIWCSTIFSNISYQPISFTLSRDKGNFCIHSTLEGSVLNKWPLGQIFLSTLMVGLWTTDATLEQDLWEVWKNPRSCKTIVSRLSFFQSTKCNGKIIKGDGFVWVFETSTVNNRCQIMVMST